MHADESSARMCRQPRDGSTRHRQQQRQPPPPPPNQSSQSPPSTQPRGQSQPPANGAPSAQPDTLYALLRLGDATVGELEMHLREVFSSRFVSPDGSQPRRMEELNLIDILNEAIREIEGTPETGGDNDSLRAPSPGSEDGGARGTHSRDTTPPTQ